MLSLRLLRVLRSLPRTNKPKRILSLARVTLSPDACRRLGISERTALEVRVSGNCTSNHLFVERDGLLRYAGGYVSIYKRKFIPANRAIVADAERAHRRATGRNLT